MSWKCGFQPGSSADNLNAVLTYSNQPREVAVVVPAYNAANYLARALDSVLAQTHADTSLYVIDDGSTDETPSVVESYADRVIHCRQKHAGQAVARNHGIRMSGSPFIAFLDADDYWEPDKLERQIAVLKQNPAMGLVCTDCATINQGKLAGSHFGGEQGARVGKLFDRLVRDCFIFTPTVLVRRKCLEEVGLFNESLVVSEDFNLWLRIAARWEIAVIPEVLAVRETRSEGLSLSTRPEIYLQNGIAALEDVRSKCNGLSPTENRALEKAIAERYYVYGSYLLATSAQNESRTNLKIALQRQPAHWRAWAKLALSFLPEAAVRRLLEVRRTTT